MYHFSAEHEKMLYGVPRTPSALPVTLLYWLYCFTQRGRASSQAASSFPLTEECASFSQKNGHLSATWVFLFVYEFTINVRIVWFVPVWSLMFSMCVLCMKRNRSPVARIKHSDKWCCQPPPHFWTLFPVYVTGYHL